ncbi:PP2C family protein-serine/threonine phosphatase [Amycolatopsis sp. WQ 127309]|uniref:PP2C family protein-serine/threonine phosphatase n=1 Tax=Amycolatopsis sp. WQ 127309 TaxID=2932773 RepID=UPI001FF2CD94|nr:SpoIIE family protein phosphatase [Amycolatopsis sp. WQ 127309]UOZ12016.1 SpoIIE family protein phosphatase [Amycolatopsis sp. WQ 127309]
MPPLSLPSAVNRLSVLLVEDDDGDALLVEEMLADVPVEAERITLLRVATLAAALPHVGGVDCVLLDLQLPDASGLTALTTLRRHSPGSAIVVLTGQNDTATGVAAVAAGAQDYLGKDQVDGPLLMRAMRYAWERRRAEGAEQRLLEQQLLAGENARLERGLLPTPLLADDGLGLAVRYRPGRDGALLGGDFYDTVELADGTVEVIIGDVCGHGPDEAALGVALRIAWRALVLAGLPATEVLATVDRVLVNERIEPLFATACVVTVAPDRTSARMVLAGHPPPLLLGGAGPVEFLSSDGLGPPLGLPLKRPRRQTEVALAPGWSLLLYTDGIFEGRSGGGDRLGRTRMAALAGELLTGPGDAGAALDALIGRVQQLNDGPVDDDIALVLLTQRAAGGAR